jgi:acyl carrier protein
LFRGPPSACTADGFRATIRAPCCARPQGKILSALPSAPTSSSPTEAQRALELEMAQLFVTSLNLEMKAGEIDPEAPLFGEGLGLDSIDVLEVALEISHRYGFQLRSDDENNQQIFRNLRSLTAHVAQHRKT